MTVTGLYLVLDSAATSTFETIKDRVIKRYQPQSEGRWSLEHRLMRETMSSTEDMRALRYLHILGLSHHEGKSYISISAPQSQGGAQSTTSTPMPELGNDQEAASVIVLKQAQTGDFVQLMVAKMGPLWAQRSTLHVANGSSFQFGDFRVRIGEVKQGQNATHKGVITEIEWLAGSESDSLEHPEGVGSDDWEAGELVIRAFWESLGISGGRESIRGPGIGQGKGMDLVRQYCEILRLR